MSGSFTLTVLIIIFLLLLTAATFAITIAVLIRMGKLPQKGEDAHVEASIERLRTELSEQQQRTRTELADLQYRIAGEANEQLHIIAAKIAEQQHEIGTSSAERQRKALADLAEQSTRSAEGLRVELTNTLSKQAEANERSLEEIRKTMEMRIRTLQQENAVSLERMRETVDEKLHKTLEERIGQSFKLVSERLEQVYRGLGEMQKLATGVGDLQKVLSNVKTRGMLGEIQLRAILEELLIPDQYEENKATVPGSSARVEFAIKLPGDEDGGGPVYLPIDSKFPGDAYANLLDAYESGDKTAVETAQKTLTGRLRGEAKSIHEKYVSPPSTTDFAILFLPTEGLYAEVVKLGMVEVLQREYKVNIAGPTTMAALLNSLQMGFKTLAIQRRSGEVWDVLSAVKGEFQKFEGALKNVQKRLNQADKDLETLVGTRTRVINRKLKDVSTLNDTEGSALLDEPDMDPVPAVPEPEEALELLEGEDSAGDDE